MSKLICTFWVSGLPATAGSKRGFPIKRKDGTVGVSMVPDNKRAKPWMAAVAAAAHLEVQQLVRDPIYLRIELFFPRPKGHYGTGRNSGKLKPSAPQHHITKPDALKCARAIEDALSGVVWHDDSQVVEHSIRKLYGDQAGAMVTVRKA